MHDGFLHNAADGQALTCLVMFAAFVK